MVPGPGVRVALSLERSRREAVPPAFRRLEVRYLQIGDQNGFGLLTAALESDRARASWTWQENSFPPGILFPVTLTVQCGGLPKVFWDLQNLRNHILSHTFPESCWRMHFIRKQGESEDLGVGPRELVAGAGGSLRCEEGCAGRRVWESFFLQGADGPPPASARLGRGCGFRELRVGLDTGALKTEQVRENTKQYGMWEGLGVLRGRGVNSVDPLSGVATDCRWGGTWESLLASGEGGKCVMCVQVGSLWSVTGSLR